MRGSPLLRAFFALAVLLALGWPLHRLLRAENAVAAASVTVAEKPAAAEKLSLHVEFTVAPAEWRVSAAGAELWTQASPGLTVDREIALPFPKEGVELHVECSWPESQRAAAKVSLTAPDGSEYTRVLWGEGSTSEVLSFP